MADVEAAVGAARRQLDGTASTVATDVEAADSQRFKSVSVALGGPKWGAWRMARKRIESGAGDGAKSRIFRILRDMCAMLLTAQIAHNYIGLRIRQTR